MNRLVSTVESFVRGDAKELIKANEKEAKVRAEEEISMVKVKTDSHLVEVQKAITSGQSSEEIQVILDRIMNDLMPMDQGDFLK